MFCLLPLCMTHVLCSKQASKESCLEMTPPAQLLCCIEVNKVMTVLWSNSKALLACLSWTLAAQLPLELHCPSQAPSDLASLCGLTLHLHVD